MQLKMEAVLLGMEHKVSTKTGNPYDVLLIGQGVDTFNAMVRGDDLKADSLTLYQPYQFSVDYNPKYNQFAIVGFIPAKPKS